MDFEKAIRPLGRFTPMLEKVPQAVRDAVFDIRISVDKPVLLCCGDRILFLREDGDTAQYFSQNNVTATREDVEEIFLRLCGYSVYSHMEEIRGGFVSADRALRVGIGGTAVIEKGGIKTVRDVTSLSVRIPRESARPCRGGAALRRRPEPRAAACWRAVLGQDDAAAGYCTIYRYGGASRGGA